MRNVYQEALEAWGLESQVRQTIEELSELMLALCKKLRGSDNIEQIAEEIADVEIMLEQLKYAFVLNNLVQVYKDFKLERLKNI